MGVGQPYGPLSHREPARHRPRSPGERSASFATGVRESRARLAACQYCDGDHKSWLAAAYSGDTEHFDGPARSPSIARSRSVRRAIQRSRPRPRARRVRARVRVTTAMRLLLPALRERRPAGAESAPARSAVPRFRTAAAMEGSAAGGLCRTRGSTEPGRRWARAPLRRVRPAGEADRGWGDE